MRSNWIKRIKYCFFGFDLWNTSDLGILIKAFLVQATQSYTIFSSSIMRYFDISLRYSKGWMMKIIVHQTYKFQK